MERCYCQPFYRRQTQTRVHQPETAVQLGSPSSSLELCLGIRDLMRTSSNNYKYSFVSQCIVARIRFTLAPATTTHMRIATLGVSFAVRNGKSKLLNDSPAETEPFAPVVVSKQGNRRLQKDLAPPQTTALLQGFRQAGANPQSRMPKTPGCQLCPVLFQTPQMSSSATKTDQLTFMSHESH